MTPNPDNSPGPAPELSPNAPFSRRSFLGIGLGLGLVALVVLLLVVFGEDIWNRNSNDTLAQARHAGVIRIGYAVEAPYAFLALDGKVTGESPETASVIATRLGIARIEWRLAEFGDLIEGLEANQFDVIAAGMFITPERQQRVAFSAPTFQVRPGLLVRKGNPLALHSYSDLQQRTNVRIAVLTGSTEEKHLLELGVPLQRLLRSPDAASARAAVRSGDTDALALSAPTIRWMVAHPIAGRTEMAEPFEEATGTMVTQYALGGYAFRLSDRELRAAWDAELSRFIGSAEHQRLVSRFGFTAEELPGRVAAPDPMPKF